ncbi:MAG TPA: O-antigen ligase family protein [Candidatus Kapabacteria bacterium]|nr:O-antigen ligase family protein [Candidatus Kapabacteria bacterium]
MFTKKQTLSLLCIYALIRIVSFVATPYPIVETLCAGFLICLFLFLAIRKPQFLSYLVLGEFFLHGAGHFFEFFGISLRTIFLCLTILTFFLSPHLLRHQVLLSFSRLPFYSFLLFSFCLFIAAGIGYANGHGLHVIIQDMLPYVFFLFYIPFCVWKKDTTFQDYIIRLTTAFIIGTTLFSLITFFIYATGVGTIQDGYYHWFRDVAMGKITDMGSDFYRIVLPEHIVFVPLLLVFASLFITNTRKYAKYMFVYTCILLVLAMNLSRTFYLALIPGFFTLLFFYRSLWKQWLIVGVVTVIGIGSLFTLLHLSTSHFTSPGWDLLGIRLSSIARPEKETSTSIRMMLIPDILHAIKKHPIVGTGLGSSLSFIHPITKQPQVTTNFDWGYLELWTKLGFFGLLFYLLLLGSILRMIYVSDQLLTPALFAGGIAFLVMGIFGPALFHVFGIVYFTFTLAQTKNPL